MITDLFSHKIHSSSREWVDKLVELACLFSQFDGQVYDRNAICAELSKISPRSTFAPRDPSKFRDEISAYPAYLGLYKLVPSSDGWVVKLSDTAKRLLVQEEPDVASFMRMQLLIFQYPNGMGARYDTGTNRLRMQSNACARTLEFLSKGINLSPLRLICKAIKADSILRRKPLLESEVSFSEVFALANSSRVNRRVLPSDSATCAILRDIRQGRVNPPLHFERRFHILKHTELFEVKRTCIKVRAPINEEDRQDLREKIEIICATNIQFGGFDYVRNRSNLEEAVRNGLWGEYFDAVHRLSEGSVRILSSDMVRSATQQIGLGTMRERQPKIYQLTRRGPRPRPDALTTKKVQLADPEVTRIKRERRHLAHKALVGKMEELVQSLRAIPLENQHIDLFAKIPGDGSFLFEMKSGGENLLEQIRKAVSQLYEYRYRYKGVLPRQMTLCIVTTNDPADPQWLKDYLVKDRDICICWFDGHGNLKYPISCKHKLRILAQAS